MPNVKSRQKIFKIQKFKAGLSENHNSNGAKIKTEKITIGTSIMDINIINLDTIMPLISLDNSLQLPYNNFNLFYKKY